MVRPDKIKWLNIWYMLMYAIEELEGLKVDDTDVDNCKSTADLLAKLMRKAIELLYANNYYSDYKRIEESTERPKGKLLVYESLRSGKYEDGKIRCKYHIFSIDNWQNRVIKAAIKVLLTYGKNIEAIDRNSLVEVINDMSEVKNIDTSEIIWEELDIKEQQDWYKPALLMSKLIIDNLLCKDDKAGEDKRLWQLEEEDRLKYIFEKFVGRFYKLEYVGCIVSTDEHYEHGGGMNILDILLHNDDIAFIVDTKWYGAKTSNSTNKRQMLDYCTSVDESDAEEIASERRENKREIISMLLYAQNESKIKDEQYIRGPYGSDKQYIITVRAIDMNQEFEQIKTDLVRLADGVFKGSDKRIEIEREKIIES